MSVGAKAVRAAGGAVWRTGSGGEVEVLLVHRPRYDDWSLPKGKAEAGEPDAATALREVEEETGMRAVLGVELASVRYQDHKGRDKVVRYWAMTVPGDMPTFVPNDEVDRIHWLRCAAARTMLTYDHDRVVVDTLLTVLRGHTPEVV
ncbi:MAG: NUDIX hydrolase [Acidimicrobiales bacterium]